jgi:hypothetical protein
MRGTYRGEASNFGLWRRSGTLEAPVCIIGDDPAWGNCTWKATDPLTTSACVGAGEAFGNPDWANWRRAAISGAESDVHRGVYEGGVPGTLACLPDLADANLYDYDDWYALSSAEIAWPSPAFDPATSRCRVDISLLPAPEQTKLLACRATGIAPRFQIRMQPNNTLREVAAMFCDETGAAAPLTGNYMVAVDPAWGTSTPYAGNQNRLMVTNLPGASARPGRYALNPVAGWLIYKPRGNGGAIEQANLKTGLNTQSHVWVRGIRFEGFTNTWAWGASGLAVNCRVEHCQFPGSTGTDKENNTVLNFNAGVDTFVARHNSFGRTVRGAQLRIGRLKDALIACNHFRECGDTALNFGTTNAAAINVMVRDNLIEDCNGGHGNAYAHYLLSYRVTVRGNIIRNCARPFTHQTGGGVIDEETNGPAGLLLEDNLFMRNEVDGTSWTLRFYSSSAFPGLIIRRNLIDGGTGTAGGNSGKPCYAPFSNADDPSIANDNVVLGTFNNASNAALLFAGASNTKHAGNSAEAAALRAEWLTRTISPARCAGGVGA